MNETRQIKYKGELDLAGFKLPCYVLEDGTRVLSGRGISDALKMTEISGKKGPGSRLDRILGQKSLQPFIFPNKKVDHYKPIICYDGNQKVSGLEATRLVDLCDGMLEARNHIELSTRQAIITKQCEILVRLFAKTGIIALVDEATGYQKERPNQELLNNWKKELKQELQKELKSTLTLPKTKQDNLLTIRYWLGELIHATLFSDNEKETEKALIKLKNFLFSQEIEFWDQFAIELRFYRQLTNPKKKSRLPLTMDLFYRWRWKKCLGLKSSEVKTFPESKCWKSQNFYELGTKIDRLSLQEKESLRKELEEQGWGKN